MVFKDHCDYGQLELKKIRSLLLEKKIHTIVTTMKDFVKIKHLFKNIDLYVININCEKTGKGILFATFMYALIWIYINNGID